MPRTFTPKVLTANLLRGGDAVWLTEAGDWSPRIEEAELLEDQGLAEIRLIEAEAQAHVVVGAYLADAKRGPHGPEAVHFREAFRTRGPSNYPHGKQATALEH